MYKSCFNLIILFFLSIILCACGNNNDKANNMKMITLSYQNSTRNDPSTQAILTWNIKCPSILAGNDWEQKYITNGQSLSFEIPKNVKCSLSLLQYQDAVDSVIYYPNLDGILVVALDETGSAKLSPTYAYYNFNKTKKIPVAASVINYELKLYSDGRPQEVPFDDTIKVTLIPLKINVVFNMVPVVDPTDVIVFDISCPNAFNGLGYFVSNFRTTQAEAMTPESDCSAGVCIIQDELCYLILKSYNFHVKLSSNSNTIFSDELIPKESSLIIYLDQLGLVKDKSTKGFDYAYQHYPSYSSTLIKACNTKDCIAESTENFSIFLNISF